MSGAVGKTENPSRPVRLASWASGAAAFIGLGVLLGWALGVPILTKAIAAGAPLNPVAALAAVFVGIGLLLHLTTSTARLRRIGLAAAVSGCLIPLARIIELLLRTSNTLDRALFPGLIPADQADAPDRFAASHAILLFLLAAAALLLRKRSENTRLISRTIGIVLGSLLGIALLGLISRVVAGAAASSGTPPAGMLTILLLILSLAVVGASAEPLSVPGSETIRSLRRRISGALGMAFGILILASGISLWSEYRSQEAARQRGGARVVTLGIAGVLDALSEAEAAVLGYLLAGDSSELVRFARARDSIIQRVRRLDSAGSTSQDIRFTELGNLVSERVAPLSRAIALEAGGHRNQALAIARSNGDRATVERIRAEAARLTATSDSIAQRWDERLRRDGRIAALFTLLGGIFALTFLAIAGVAFNRDLNRRAQAETELAASEQRLSQLVSLLPNVVVLKEPKELRYVLVNWAGTNSVGFAREEVLGKTAFDILPEEEARRVTEEDRLALQSPGVIDLPDRVVHSPRLGSRIIHSKKVAMRDDRGAPVYLLTVAEDVTERKQAEEAIRSARDAAEAANRAKSGFLAKMSHELRTPLNSIIGFSEILEAGGAGILNDKQRRYVGNVLLSGRNLLQLINDILDLSKVEAGRVELTVSRFPVTPLLEEVRTVLETLASKKRISVNVLVAPETPAVRGDRARIAQVLINLAGNAVKFTPEGGRIDIMARPLGQSTGPPAGVEFAVRDTGVGISPEDQQRIFREFEQVGSGSPGEREGTGLGLSLAKGLVELHGGTIGVESAPGEGSIFRFTLPGESAAADPVPSRIDGTVPDGDGPLILVVDDEPAARDLLAHHLEDSGYRVMTAGLGGEAIALASRFRPDAITLDILMPKQDGFEILADLKSNEDTRSIPVVVVSVVETRKLGFSLGADEWLVKPVQREALLGALDRVLGKAEATVCRVLVIDDDGLTREHLSELLSHHECEVRLADRGARGVELARQEQPDVIVLDLVMPGMNGFEVVQKLRADDRTRNVPILILTAKDLSTEERAELRQSVQAVVAKGAMSTLLEELDRLVARGKVAG